MAVPYSVSLQLVSIRFLSLHSRLVLQYDRTDSSNNDARIVLRFHYILLVDAFLECLSQSYLGSFFRKSILRQQKGTMRK